MTRIAADTLYGTLNLIILQSLDTGPLHGLAVARHVRERTDAVLEIGEGALYPALHRLERDGLIAAEWGTSDRNRKAKFYSLTPRGRISLEQEARNWTRHNEAIGRLFPGS